MKIVVVLMVLVCAQLTAQGGLISGTGGAPSWPNWLAPTTIDFESQPAGLFSAMLIGNTKFIGVDGQLNITSLYAGNYNTDGTQSLQSATQFDPITPHTIEFDFTLPVSAVAFNWGAADNAWLMSAYDSSNNLLESHIITLPYSGTNLGEYFGVNNSGIKKLVLQDQLDNYPNGDYVFIDDFTTSRETTPEPAAIGSLMLSIALLRRAKR